MAAAMIVSFAALEAGAQRTGLDRDVHPLLMFSTCLAGVAVGSKAHMVLSTLGAGGVFDVALLDPSVGHSFLGSFVGALAFLVLLRRFLKFDLLAALDVWLSALLLGHFVGKWGCFLSGDGCYGPVADPRKVPWAMSFPHGRVPTLEPVHPTPVYEGSLSLVTALFVRRAMPWPSSGPTKRLDDASGSRSALTLVLFGLSRLAIEPFRRHPRVVPGGFTEYQAIALLLVGAGVAIGAVAWAGRTSVAAGSPQQGHHQQLRRRPKLD